MATDLTAKVNLDGIANGVEKILLPLAIIFWLMVGWYVHTLSIPRAQFGVLVLGFSVSFYSLMELPESMKERKYFDIVMLILAAAFSIWMTYYMYTNFDELFYFRTGYGYWYEYIFAGVVIITIIYYTYREFGAAFTAVAVGSLAYVRWGYMLEGISKVLSHPGFSWERTVMTGALEFSGIYGSLTQIVSAWIAMLLLYAGLLRGYGAFDLITRAAGKTATVIRTGVAQSAVMASLLIGMINGAQTANAAMTGSFTIPMMKSSGIKAKTAGAIEAVASSGGQIMPPVMGAAAFVMAALLAETYATVLIAGLVPAVIFYLSVATAVHYRALGQLDLSSVGFDPNKSEYYEADKTRQDLIADAVKFGVPFVILLYTLGIAQYTVSTAGLYTVVSMIGFGIGVPIVQSAITNRQIKSSFVDGVRETLVGLKFGFEIFAPIVIIIAVVNLIVDLLNATGVPGIMSLFLLDLSGGTILIGVILSMIICIILGMGMPTVAAYTLVALLIAPTLVGDYGIPDMAAHFFVFYAAMLSGITPPIAIAVIVTSGIAESDFWATALEAMRIAVVLFILPFAFVYNPGIIMDPFSANTLFSSALMMVGAYSLVHGLNYEVQDMGKILHLGSRAIYVVLGVVAMAYPTELIRIGAVTLFGAILLVQWFVWDIHEPQELPSVSPDELEAEPGADG